MTYDINFKIKTDRIEAFEFTTEDPKWVDEAEQEESLFRYEIHDLGGYYEHFIAVAYSLDYDVMEEVTDLFTLQERTKLIEQYEAEKHDMEDHTLEYLIHIGEDKLSFKMLNAFKNAYMANVFNTMDEQTQLEQFGTTDHNEIVKHLEESIADMETIEDVRNGFDYEYDEVLLGAYYDN